MVLMFIFTSDRTGTGITFPLEKTFLKILIIYMEQQFSDTRHQAVQGIGSWEKENKWVLWLPQLMPGERIQVAAQGESTRAEPRGLPELRKKTWESREAKGGEAHRAEYSRGVSYTERKRSNLRRVPCETEAECSCMHRRKLLRLEKEPPERSTRSNHGSSHKAMNSLCSC